MNEISGQRRDTLITVSVNTTSAPSARRPKYYIGRPTGGVSLLTAAAATAVVAVTVAAQRRGHVKERGRTQVTIITRPTRARILCGMRNVDHGYFVECGMRKKLAERGIICGMEKCGKVILQRTNSRVNCNQLHSQHIKCSISIGYSNSRPTFVWRISGMQRSCLF